MLLPKRGLFVIALCLSMQPPGALAEDGELSRFITRTRVGIGFALDSAARGPRLSLLHRWIMISGMYGLERSGDPWNYDSTTQVTLDLHRKNSEYSPGSLFVGATGTLSEHIRGLSAHAGLRLFPNALGERFSISTKYGWTFWDKEPGGDDLPEFYWSVGVDYFF